MNRIGVFIILIVISFLSITKSIGAAGGNPDYSLLSDGHGAPKLVVKGASLPVVGSFWLHFFGDHRNIDHQLSIASIDFNNVVKTCVINTSGVNLNFSDWHFVKWILQRNEFSCILIGSERANLTSALVNLSVNDTAAVDKLAYTISPGAGNSDFCIANLTLVNTQVLDCVRLRKLSSTTVSPNNDQICDCPNRPSKLSIIDGRHIIFDQGGGGSGEAKTELRSNTVSISDDGGDRWRNSSLWPLSKFPTPKPFEINTINETTSVPPSTPILKSTKISTTKLVNNLFGGGAAAATTILVLTISTPIPISNHSCDWRCLNGGSCRQNSTRQTDKSYCNCTSGYFGEFCENNASEHYRQNQSISRHQSTIDSKCPTDFCQKRGACRPAVGEQLNATNSMPNFTCFCEEGYLGRRCSYFNVCYWETPCDNGGYCSIIVPLVEDDDQKSMIANASFKCQCPRGFDGDRCQINLSPHVGGTDIGKGKKNESLDQEQCSVDEAAACKNGAACYMHNNQFVCNCTANFTGAHCEKQIVVGESSSSKTNVGAIVGGILGGLALIGLLIGSVFVYRCIQRSRKLKGKYNPAKEEMTASGGQTLSMATVTTGERLI